MPTYLNVPLRSPSRWLCAGRGVAGALGACGRSAGVDLVADLVGGRGIGPWAGEYPLVAARQTDKPKKQQVSSWSVA